MRYQCTEWCEGFTMGAVYHSSSHNPKLINDEGELVSLSFSFLVLHFEVI